MDYRLSEDGKLIIQEYNASISKKFTFLFILVLGIIAMICVACAYGGRNVEVFSIPGIIADHLSGVTYAYNTDAWWDDFIVCEIRLPRVFVACVAGASLAVCGSAVQSLMNNPLASPYTMGISSGAGFGATLAIVMGFSMGNAVGTYGVSVNAFIFGMIPVAAILVLSRMIKLTPVMLILVGIAISMFFSSLSTLVFLNADEGSIEAAYLWELGDLSNVRWSDFTPMAVMMVLGSVTLYLVSWKFNVMTLGEDSAKTLGVDTNRFRILTLSLLALMTMTVVAFVGVIGFVGLIVPHMVRSIIGSDNRFVMPGSLLLGALFLLSADTLARVVTGDAIPVGTVMGIFGAPMFLYLIMKRNSQFRGAWRCRSSTVSSATTRRTGHRVSRDISV